MLAIRLTAVTVMICCGHKRDRLPSNRLTRHPGGQGTSRGSIAEMAASKPAAAPERNDDQLILDQLQRILRSSTFQQVDRLKRFLTFIVDEAIQGRRHELKEYGIGVQVFGKEENSTRDPADLLRARRRSRRRRRRPAITILRPSMVPRVQA